MPYSRKRTTRRRKSRPRGRGGKRSSRRASVVTRKEARTIAKNVIKSVATPKLFDTSHSYRLIPSPCRVRVSTDAQGNPIAAALGGVFTHAFHTGGSQEQNLGGPMNESLCYGQNNNGQPVIAKSMNLNKIYRVSTQGMFDYTPHQMPDGDTIRPLKSVSKFIIERLAVNYAVSDYRDSLPMFCRVIRVQFKSPRGGSIVNDPKSDLFLGGDNLTSTPALPNQSGMNAGDTTNYYDFKNAETGVNREGFSSWHLRMLRVNTRKYKLLNDMQFVLDPALTYCKESNATSENLALYTASQAANPPTANPLTYTPAQEELTTHNFGAAGQTNIGFYGGKSSQKEIRFRHDIGTKLVYKFDDTVTDAGGNTGVGFNNKYPKAGGKTEMIFFHYCYMGDPTGSVPYDQTNAVTDADDIPAFKETPDLVRLNMSCESTFYDV